MIKYKKISEGVYEKFSEQEVSEGVFKLEDIKKTRDYYNKKLKEMDALVKELEKLKVE